MVATAPPPVPVKAKPRLGDIIADALPELWGAWWLDGHKAKVLDRVSRCGTKELGVVQLMCDACGAIEWRPLSCQDRHCPSCGGRRAEEWVQARLGDLLDVPAFHLVFPVPAELHPFFREDPRELYSLLFSAVQRTLKQLVADSDDLNGTPAFFCALHTNNRRLDFFPHIHVFMAGATFDPATGKLDVVPDHHVLFPPEVLDEAFRTRFLEDLRALVVAGTLTMRGNKTRPLADPEALDALIDRLTSTSWNTWLQPSPGGSEATIRYLAQYYQRTAITNANIAGYDGTSVTYTWRDFKTRQRRSKTLPRNDFIRLFAQHILPKGFQRIRFYGLFAATARRERLPRAQAAANRWAERCAFTRAVTCVLDPPQLPPMRCERCQVGTMRTVAIFRRDAEPVFLDPWAHAQPPPMAPAPARRGAK